MSSDHGHARDFDRMMDVSNAVHSRFLATELEAGIAFLNTVEASKRPENVAQALALAREACDVVTKHLADVTLTNEPGDLGETIRTQYAELKRRLEEVERAESDAGSRSVGA